MEEGLAVKFREDELKEAVKPFENSLLVKIVVNRGSNRATFKKVLMELWNPVNSLKFTELKGNVLIATFAQESDRDRVLSRGPWRFMGWTLQVELQGSRYRIYFLQRFRYGFKFIIYLLSV